MSASRAGFVPPPSAPTGLAPEELSRYSRHLLLPEFGEEGQRRLKASTVAIVGMGGLGAPAAIYLAAVGVGTLRLIDPDRVDASNLQRQVLYGDRDVGRGKVEVARERLAALNPHVVLEGHAVALTSANALELLSGADVVLDGTDNFPTRYLVNDACVMLGVPNVHGSVLRFEGRVSVFATADGPCYRCLFPSPPPPDSAPDCAEAGVLGVMPGQIGLLQATEAIKVLTGLGEPLVGRLLLVDALRMGFRTITIRRDPACPACGTRTLRELIDYEEFCGVRRAVDDGPARLSPDEVARRLRAADPPQLVDVREPWEWNLTRLAGATLIPLGRLDELLGTLDRSRETVVYCHHGGRSLRAAQRLMAAGFTRVANLEGGIDRWSVEVDPTLPRY
ncbi:MAG TPA: molybdopterin-synthase adenylyltransferase MoeB [Gemmatimonadaceae bacterium]